MQYFSIVHTPTTFNVRIHVVGNVLSCFWEFGLKLEFHREILSVKRVKTEYIQAIATTLTQ